MQAAPFFKLRSSPSAFQPWVHNDQLLHVPAGISFWPWWAVPLKLWENKPFLPTGAFVLSFHRHEERYLLKYSGTRLNMKGEEILTHFQPQRQKWNKSGLKATAAVCARWSDSKRQKWNCGCQRLGQGCLLLFTMSPLKVESVWKGWWCLYI